MRKFLTLLIFAVMPLGYGFAESPKVKDVVINVSAIEKGDIEQGKVVPIGDTVMVSILESSIPKDAGETIDPKVKAVATKQTVSYSVNWDVYELVVPSSGKPLEVRRKFKEFEKNTISFGTGIKATELKTECIITFLFLGMDNEGKLVYASTQTHKYVTKILIGQMPNPPNPGPSPVVPDDEVPVGKLGIGKDVYDAINSVGNSKDVAKNYKEQTLTTINEISAGKLKNPEQILKAWRDNLDKSNNGSVNPDVLESMDKFANKLQPMLVKLYTDKKLLTVENYKDLLNDMVIIFDKVK